MHTGHTRPLGDLRAAADGDGCDDHQCRWRTSIAALQRALSSRMDSAIAALAKLPVTVPVVPKGGITLWLRLPDHVDDVEFADAAVKVGVSILPGRPWFPAEAPGSFVRLSVAAAAELAITTAVERLGPLLTA